jgi:hypothetical protein
MKDTHIPRVPEIREDTQRLRKGEREDTQRLDRKEDRKEDTHLLSGIKTHNVSLQTVLNGRVEPQDRFTSRCNGRRGN